MIEQLERYWNGEIIFETQMASGLEIPTAFEGMFECPNMREGA